MYNAIIYCDGACLMNPGGPGGFAAIVDFPATNQRRQITGESPETTNNRMELCGALAGLECVHQILRKKSRHRIRLVSDSQYLVHGLNEWLRGWVKRNFLNVKNSDLWMRLWNLSKNHQLTAEWVRGHSGHPENELADYLALGAAKQAERKLRKEKHDERRTHSTVGSDSEQPNGE